MKELRACDDMSYQRIYDRIFDMCVPICVDGVSKRLASAEEKVERYQWLNNFYRHMD
ncbi:MAG: hypothetical protein IJ655_05115 [Lachnospiraceae bacterium]|nr:hypothetical protein [Lachnospiraceae bacterium]